MKLQPKILFLVLGILIVSLTSLSFPLYWYTRSALEEEMDQGLQGVLEISKQTLDRRLISLLVQEPELEVIRRKIEKTLNTLLVREVKGAAIFSVNGRQLASSGTTPAAGPFIGNLIPESVKLSPGSPGMVSSTYRLPNNNYLKTAVATLKVDDKNSVILVIWCGARFMAFIDQLRGSILWVLIIAIIIAISLTFTFSRSLLLPVKQLSEYTKAIQKNINTNPVELGRKDELGDLNKALNEMHLEIKENEQRNKQFLADVAHEIKNPLGGLELYLGLINEETGGGNPINKYLEKISHEINNLKFVISSYLNYSRPINNVPEPLQLKAVILDVLQVVKPELIYHGTRFEISGDATFFGDELKLKSVFLNLFKNSLNAVEKGSGRIWVTIESSDHEITVTFTDNGAGIPKVAYEKLFKPFYTTRKNGAGLGLSIVKNIIEEMSGTVFIRNSDKSGTEFIITLPK